MGAHSCVVLLSFLKKYARLYVPITALSVLGAVLEAVHVSLFFPLLSRLFGAPPSSGALRLLDGLLARLPFADPLTGTCVVILFLTPLKAAINWLNEYFIGYGGATVLHDTKVGMLDKFSTAPYSFFVNSRQGDLLYQTFTAPNKLAYVLARLPQILVESMRIAAILLLLLVVHPYVTLALAIFSLLIQGMVVMITRKTSYLRGKERSKEDSSQSNLLVELFTGIKQISVYGVRSRWRAAFESSSRRFSELMIRDTAILSLPKNLMEMLAYSALAGGLLYGRLTLGDGLTAYIPMVGAFCVALLKILPALSTLSRARLEMMNAMSDVEAIHRALELRFDERPRGRRLFEGLKSAVRFDDVHFSYGDTEVLRGLSLDIARGSSVALVGGSGSGKTTAVNLLFGLHRPCRGRILIDGVPLDELDLDSFLKRVALVSQDTCVFHSTVFENVTFGRTGFSREQVERAARVAHAHEFIESLPQGYDTTVGERGMRLSGGQQQRLAIARAVLGEPDILVLDEATSALDNLSEVAVQHALQEAARGKTVIQVAHRLSTVEASDKIAVLEAGRVVEEGAHGALMAQSGRYSRLYLRQREVPTE
jgi:ABC-type multidrug transport system fused ATPase/permease subunit